MKKIAFIAHGPGTANALFPLIEPLSAKYDVHLFPFHPYASKLWGADLCLIDEFNAIFFNDFSLILTGTSSMHEVEKSTPLLAKERNIPVVSFLDKWGDYPYRYQHEPNYIITLDNRSKLDVELLGIDSSKVFPLGNPHFDRLKPYVGIYEAKKPYHIAFFSEPTEKSKEALYYLLKAKDEHPRWIHHISLTPHPREDETWLRSYCKQESNVSFHMYHDSFPLLLSADICIGVNTTLLHEATIIGKPALFYESYEQLCEELHSFSLFEFSPKRYFFDATKKCLSFIENLLK